MLVEPIVGFVLCGLALVGVIVSVILKFSGAAPKFPFWSALAMSVGLYFAFLVYGVVVRLHWYPNLVRIETMVTGRVYRGGC
jgi:hypothetical protein